MGLVCDPGDVALANAGTVTQLRCYLHVHFPLKRPRPMIRGVLECLDVQRIVFKVR